MLETGRHVVSGANGWDKLMEPDETCKPPWCHPDDATTPASVPPRRLPLTLRHEDEVGIVSCSWDHLKNQRGTVIVNAMLLNIFSLPFSN
jgi:hypothetical protein